MRDFDAKWLRRGAGPDAVLLGSADIQSLADLSSAYHIIRAMRSVPMAPSQIALVTAAAAVPAAPLVLFVIPLEELILRGVKTILHI